MEKLLAFSIVPDLSFDLKTQIKLMHAVDARRLTLPECRYLVSRRNEFDLHVRFDGGMSVNPRDTAFFTNRYADFMNVRRQDYGKFLAKFGLNVTCVPYEIRKSDVAGLEPEQKQAVLEFEVVQEVAQPKSVNEIMIVNMNAAILGKKFSLAREILDTMEMISKK